MLQYMEGENFFCLFPVPGSWFLAAPRCPALHLQPIWRASLRIIPSPTSSVEWVIRNHRLAQRLLAVEMRVRPMHLSWSSLDFLRCSSFLRKSYVELRNASYVEVPWDEEMRAIKESNRRLGSPLWGLQDETRLLRS